LNLVILCVLYTYNTPYKWLVKSTLAWERKGDRAEHSNNSSWCFNTAGTGEYTENRAQELNSAHKLTQA